LAAMKYAYAVDPCPFCAVLSDRIWIAAAHAIALPDVFPVVDRHALVVPRKHLASIYKSGILEQTAIWEPVDEVRRRFLTGFKPDGLNAGTTDSRRALHQVQRDPARCHT
jgi:diadenosine tetraphosphate (Ap4A) HIT family hydrolase